MSVQEITGKTNISDLPSSNVELEIKDKDEKLNLNDIFKKVEDVGNKGNLALPSRDIPMDQSSVTMDRKSSTNYVPDNEDYINKIYERNVDIVENQRKKQNKVETIDVIYSELEKPILMAILFFLFQLPIFNTILKKYVKGIFSNDENLNIYGYILKSVMYSSTFYLLIKSMEYISV